MIHTMKMVILFIISFQALCGEENLPTESEIRDLLLQGKRQELTNLVHSVAAKEHAPESSHGDFYLSTAMIAGSYRRAIDKDDFMLVQLASEKLISQGLPTLSQQAVLINYLSRDYKFFTTGDALEFAELRKMGADKLISILVNANEALIKIPDMKEPLSIHPSLSPALLQQFQNNGITYIPGGLPQGEKFQGEIREQYFEEVQSYVNKINEVNTRDAATRILSEGYLKPPLSYFITQYSRLPYDYMECNTFLVKAGLSEQIRKKVICAIAMRIQVLPPPELNCDCKLQVGADKGF